MTPRFLSRLAVRAAAAFVFTLGAQAEVRLHTLFTDHMVLQRGIAVPVWGWAADGEKVTVEFQGQKISTVAKQGKWMVRLKKLKAGGPEVLKVSGQNTVVVNDVLVGEVWVASGQSNMEWGLRSSFEPEADIAAANNPLLRLYTVPKLKANAPVDNVKSSWQLTSPTSVPGFSAVAYYFGQSLQKALGVPVGMIHTSWGGSPAEVWMREDVLAANPNYQRDILDAFTAQEKKVQSNIAQWEQERAAAQRDGKPFSRAKPSVGWKPCELYNGMIAPLLPYGIQGAIWYQGESNAGRAHEYRTLFADMIRNWRKDWGQGNFPFLEVQLAPFKAIKEDPAESDWAELREAQLIATKSLPKVGMAVITDYGDAKDIHPRWKKPVGERLALAARGIAYGEKVVHSGPAFRRLKIDGHRAVLSFDHIGSGLVVGQPREEMTKASPIWSTVAARQGNNPRALVGFAIAGEDRKFVWAQAEIHGQTVVVSHPSVPHPVAVRFGWADCPAVNLYNVEGLPASPFRSDDWPMITAPKASAAVAK